jgi:hypothetical protein
VVNIYIYNIVRTSARVAGKFSILFVKLITSYF